MVNISCKMDSSFMRSGGSTWLVSSMLGTTVMRTKATLYGHWLLGSSSCLHLWLFQ